MRHAVFMKKYLVGSLVLSLLAVSLFFGSGSSAQTGQLLTSDDDRIISTDRKPKDDAAMMSTTLVLSQVSGGNGTYANDWVEIKNISATSQSLNGLALYYGSATGLFGAGSFSLPNVSIAPGKFYLVQLGSGNGAGALPTPDASTTNINMSGSSGKVGIVNPGALGANVCGSTATPCSPAQMAAFVDWVAYGAAGNGTAGNGEGGTSVNNGVAFSTTQSGSRKNAGCTDTDNNNLDFDVVTGTVPRNSSSAASPCGGGGADLLAGMAASPASVVPTGTTLLTVTVVPATTPPSTGIQVVGDVTQLGGSATQTFVDDGTGGDVTPGDNVFSYLLSIPNGTIAGIYNVTAVASDAEMRFVNLNQNITVTGPPETENPLLFGNPSNATANVANENNYLMTKAQYSLSYNRSKAGPNWVAWRLDSSWIGGADRQNDYRPDTTLPAGWYRVQPSDYSEPVYDRGHMCPSGDRTRSVADNSATFLMTNFLPQHPDNNQGPWEEFETYCRTLASQGKEIYIYTGPAGQDMAAGGGTGFIGNGVVVPASTWKVVLVIDNGTNDLQRVGKKARMFGIIVSNIPPINRNAPWRNFRVTVDQVETLTGYDFFSNLNPRLQARMESSPDTQ